MNILEKKLKLPDRLNSKGELVSLMPEKGRGLVLYFYPKDDTPGCTLQGQQFSKLNKKFEALKFKVFGISRDSVKSHDKFSCKYDFKIDLLSDEDQALCEIFGVIKEKNMYGKKVLGIERSTFVISDEGKVLYEERGVKADGHADALLEKIKAL